MKNVKIIFTDTDYELVTKAYKHYNKLIENYQRKEAAFGLSSLIMAITGGFLALTIYNIINSKLISSIVLLIIVILTTSAVISSAVYGKKGDIVNQYRTECFNVERNMADIKKDGKKLQFGIDVFCSQLFYEVSKPAHKYRRYMLTVDKASDADNIVLILKETTDKHGNVSYVWRAESA